MDIETSGRELPERAEEEYKLLIQDDLGLKALSMEQTQELLEIHEEWMAGRMYLSNVDKDLDENPVNQMYRKGVA